MSQTRAAAIPIRSTSEFPANDSTADSSGPVVDLAAGRSYRFERLRLGLVLADMRFRPGDPGPGDTTPPFDMPTVDGGRFRSEDLGESGPVLMVFGSSTCPVTE